jgi:hypothetical protein
MGGGVGLLVFGLLVFGVWFIGFFVCCGVSAGFVPKLALI